ncbi:hypothetical protein [Streptomyces sp. WAC06614]|uniref:hypothetical protein n=1 Tax=Streptomyces sp. WAC06614 TaxID=2487416 RepID=UPI000F78DFBE|nr:hypothetical protein [Streptomyces sp. WAC06614]RSS68666.1 hypothetical protein EF918_28130 [Streptomyces sp. WAC06614]
MILARWTQRVFLTLLALLPVLVVTTAFVPALLVLPFRRTRVADTQALVRQLTAWTREVLRAGR